VRRCCGSLATGTGQESPRYQDYLQVCVSPPPWPIGGKHVSRVLTLEATMPKMPRLAAAFKETDPTVCDSRHHEAFT